MGSMLILLRLFFLLWDLDWLSWSYRYFRLRDRRLLDLSFMLLKNNAIILWFLWLNLTAFDHRSELLIQVFGRHKASRRISKHLLCLIHSDISNTLLLILRISRSLLIRFGTTFTSHYYGKLFKCLLFLNDYSFRLVNQHFVG